MVKKERTPTLHQGGPNGGVVPGEQRFPKRVQLVPCTRCVDTFLRLFKDGAWTLLWKAQSGHGQTGSLRCSWTTLMKL